jgi:hypothetical protein
MLVRIAITCWIYRFIPECFPVREGNRGTKEAPLLSCGLLEPNPDKPEIRHEVKLALTTKFASFQGVSRKLETNPKS